MTKARSVWPVLTSPIRKAWGFITAHNQALLVILTFPAIVAAFAGTFAAIWAVRTQNNVSRELARQQSFFLFYEQWESEGMQERRARLASELLENPTPQNPDDSPLVFLETLADAERRGLLDRQLVFNTFYVDATSYWAAARLYAETERKQEKCSCIFKELQDLSDRLDQQSRDQGESESLIGHDSTAVHRFLELERKRGITEKGP